LAKMPSAVNGHSIHRVDLVLDRTTLQ